MCFFQAEDGIRALVRSRGLGEVYKRQVPAFEKVFGTTAPPIIFSVISVALTSLLLIASETVSYTHLTLPTSDLV